MTDNHGYNTPSKGVSDWDVPLNENFKNLDADVEIRDAESNLGNYSPKQGAKFLATDTGNRFLGDGSNWNSLSYPGTAVPLNCNAHVCKQGGQTVAIDQNHSTIHSGKPAETIEAALNHAYSVTSDNQWGIVNVAQGNYTLEKEIVCEQAGGSKDRLILAGQPNRPVKLDASTLEGSNALNQEGCQHFVVKGITIDGGGKNVNLVWAKNAPVNKWIDVSLKNSIGHGMYLEDNLNSELIDVIVGDCGAADNGTYGIWMNYGDQGGDYKGRNVRCINTGDTRSDPGGATALRAKGARFICSIGQFKTNVGEDVIQAGDNNYWWNVNATAPSANNEGEAALRITGGDNHFSNCVFEKKEIGVALDGAVKSRFINCHTRFTTTAGILSASSGSGKFCEFIGYTVVNNDGDGYNVDPAGPLVINGGRVRKNGGTDVVGNSDTLLTGGAIVGTISGNVINNSEFA